MHICCIPSLCCCQNIAPRFACQGIGLEGKVTAHESHNATPSKLVMSGATTISCLPPVPSACIPPRVMASTWLGTSSVLFILFILMTALSPCSSGGSLVTDVLLRTLLTSCKDPPGFIVYTEYIKPSVEETSEPSCQRTKN